MKIELEEKDKLFINNINKDIENGEKPILYCPDKRKYSISFEVRDIAKANAFICSIVMNPNNAKEIEDLIGIRFTSLNYKEGLQIEKLKELLSRFMIELDQL